MNATTMKKTDMPKTRQEGQQSGEKTLVGEQTANGLNAHCLVHFKCTL